MKSHTAFVLLVLSCTLAMGQTNKYQCFQPGEIWVDNNNVHINAHGGGVLYHQGKYYWYGEHRVGGRGGNSARVGVHCYSSSDLYNWTDEGIVLKPFENDPGSPFARGCVIERPKVIFNQKTGKYVMWFHLELRGRGYDAAMSGVAVGDNATGPFQFIRAERPDKGAWPLNVLPEHKTRKFNVNNATFNGGGASEHPDIINFLGRDFEGGQMARDMNLFVDDDGKAYHIFSSEENSTIHISELSEDYLSQIGRYVRVFPGRYMEGAALCKANGVYYFVGSGCTGWTPNAARSASAPSLFGPWTELGNPGVGTDAELTFHSQSTYILPVVGKTNAFIFMADRWTPENAIDGRYVWLPLRFENGRMVLRWKDNWRLAEFDESASAARNLIPDKPCPTPSYWCTWTRQFYQAEKTVQKMAELEGDAVAHTTRRCLAESNLFSAEGWAAQYFPSVKKDLFLMFDDGWDVPANGSEAYFGIGELDVGRFPSCNGEPAERLKKLRALAVNAGWRGIGLWICAQEYPADPEKKNYGDAKQYALDYWTKRMKWSHAAGVAYWKIDWGTKGGSLEYRRLVSDLAKIHAPGLIVEHTVCIDPLNLSPEHRVERRIVAEARSQFEFSDVFRVYDATTQLPIATTLDRVGEHLKFRGQSRTILNFDDEIYLAAALGAAVGILRFPVDSKFIAADPFYSFNYGDKFLPTRDANRRIDEVVRLVNWQKIMPAFALGDSTNHIDEKTLSDAWVFARGDTWDARIIGKRIGQRAPARVSRNMPLPSVAAEGVVPFVVAATDRRGAVAVATLGRVTPESAYQPILADVGIQLSSKAANYVGVFGFYKSLTLNFDQPVGKPAIWAQDLAGTKAVDITTKATVQGQKVVLTGELLKEIGLSAGTPGDLSEPGLVLLVESPGTGSSAELRIAPAPEGAPLSRRYQVRLRPEGTEFEMEVPARGAQLLNISKPDNI